MKIAIITGASSGLGREFARQLDARGGLDEIWLIARRADRLEALCTQLTTPARAIPMDVTEEGAPGALEDMLRGESPRVCWLVNAAGMGKMGEYPQIPGQACADMIALNCTALVRVTQAVVPYMGRGGRILQIASSSAFQPLPGLAVYAASKAFVLRYSRALRWELYARRIGVCAVCPYWVRDTEFIDRTQRGGDAGAVRHFPLASRSARVVRSALFWGGLGVPVCTPGVVASVQRVLSKIVPHELVIALWQLIRRA